MVEPVRRYQTYPSECDPGNGARSRCAGFLDEDHQSDGEQKRPLIDSRIGEVGEGVGGGGGQNY